MREIHNTYFKDFGDHAAYISGLPIPVDSDEVCRDIHFVNCSFHAGCSVPYENCQFTDCSGRPDYRKVKKEEEMARSKYAVGDVYSNAEKTVKVLEVVWLGHTSGLVLEITDKHGGSPHTDISNSHRFSDLIKKTGLSKEEKHG